jgi:hypothetical protein
MSYLEVWYKPNFGKRLRIIQQAAIAGLHKLNGSLFSSLPQHGGAIGGIQPPPAYQPPTLTPVTGLPATGDSGGTVSVSMGIQFHQQDVPAGGKTATITYDIGSGDETVDANLLENDTPNQQAIKIAAAINGVTGLSAVKGTGTDITVTPADTVRLAKLTLSVS